MITFFFEKSIAREIGHDIYSAGKFAENFRSLYLLLEYFYEEWLGKEAGFFHKKYSKDVNRLKDNSCHSQKALCSKQHNENHKQKVFFCCYEDYQTPLQTNIPELMYHVIFEILFTFGI